MSSGELHPVLLQLERQPGLLRPQIEAALASHGEPLRWAITAVQQPAQGATLLQVEAVVIRGSLADGAGM